MEASVGTKDAMINLKDVIEVERAEALNADPQTNIKSILGSSAGLLRSDPSVDAQLLLKLSFREPIKLRGFKLQSRAANASSAVQSEDADGNTESAPKTVKLFVNNSHLSFSDADLLTPTETLTLTAGDVGGEREVRVKYVKYQHVTSLSVLVEDNIDDSDVTVINKLELIGTTIAGMNVNELKKQDDH